MDKTLAQEAIDNALSLNWEKAKQVNLQILKTTPDDTSALNRLAKAHSELGDIKKAIAIAKKVIKIDSYNKIALKSLLKWGNIKKPNNQGFTPFSGKEFLEEPGRTKIVSLLYPGDEKMISVLDSGDEVKIDTHGHRVCVTTMDGKYIGRLPDDLSLRLKKLISLGNEYKVIIKNIEKKDVRIFIKELFRAEKAKSLPSFPTEKIDYIAFTPPELVHSSKILKVMEDEE